MIWPKVLSIRISFPYLIIFVVSFDVMSHAWMVGLVTGRFGSELEHLVPF